MKKDALKGEKFFFVGNKNTLIAFGFLAAIALGVFLLLRVFVLAPSLSLSDASSATQPVYRFWSENYKHHFYTISVTERDFVIANNNNWVYEGAVFEAFRNAQQNTAPIYRFWSDVYKGHFYTKSNAEKVAVESNPDTWSYEGIGYHVLEEGSNVNPVYRFYIPESNGHFYTTSAAERDKLLTEKKKWKYEGVAFYTAKISQVVSPPPVVNPAVNGSCGGSHGQSFETAPLNQLCLVSADDPDVTDNGSWTWRCTGTNGGSDALCTAQKTSNPATECNDGLDNDGDGFIDVDDHDCTNANDDTESGTDQTPVNGLCGPSDEGTFSVRPENGLCTNGSTENRQGTGPWTWDCVGTNDGTTDSCGANAATATVSGQCGSSNNQPFEQEPTTGLCDQGEPTVRAGGTEGPWSWQCLGEGEGLNDQCQTVEVVSSTDGMCGDSNGGAFTEPPTENLCDFGTSINFQGGVVGPWSWTCLGEGSGTDDQCNADVETPLIVGSCGSSDEGTFSAAPNSGLCEQGTPTDRQGTGPWTWDCLGNDDGVDTDDDSCEAFLEVTLVTGACGTAAAPSSAEPVDNLCERGTPADRQGTGPWSWDCLGSDNEVTSDDVSCDAPLIDPPINGACDPITHGQSFDEEPTENLCTHGTSTDVTGEGPWEWHCEGLNGGTDQICTAQKNVTDFCGADHGQTLSAPPEDSAENPLCVGGSTVADQTGGTANGSPWGWSCRDGAGALLAVCIAYQEGADPTIVGQCGINRNECTYGDLIETLQEEGDTHWRWGCNGTGPGDTFEPNCSVLKNAPVVTECNDGLDNDGDGFIDVDDYDCANANDDTESGTNQMPIPGACSGLDGQTLTEIPELDEYCDAGTLSSVTTIGTTHAWSCLAETAGATNDDCTAQLDIVTTPVEGACNPNLLPQYAVLPPPEELCSGGEPDQYQGEVSTDIYHHWYCKGAGTGLTVFCEALQGGVVPICNDGIDNDGDGDTDGNDLGCSSAYDMTETGGPYTNGACGDADDQPYSTEPSVAERCAPGPDLNFSGTGPWNWTCGDGRNGGTQASCMTIEVPSVLCGPSDGDEFPYSQTWTLPSEPCYSGATPQWQTSGGDLNPRWICVDAIGTESRQCSATVLAPPPTQCADGIDNDNDGAIDFGADDDCNSAQDNTESGTLQNAVGGACGAADGVGSLLQPTVNRCAEGLPVDKSPTATDWRWDCEGLIGGDTAPCDAPIISNPPPPVTQCNDGIDNDGDGRIDFGVDLGCDSALDDSENSEVTNFCGPDDGQTSTQPPQNTLCINGTFDSDMTGGGIDGKPWRWKCRDSGGAIVADCKLFQDGVQTPPDAECSTVQNTCISGVAISGAGGEWICSSPGADVEFDNCS